MAGYRWSNIDSLRRKIDYLLSFGILLMIELVFILLLVVSASIPLVGFGKLSDNTIKGLTSVLSVE